MMGLVLSYLLHRLWFKYHYRTIRSTCIDLLFNSAKNIYCWVGLQDKIWLRCAIFPPIQSTTNTTNHDIIRWGTPSNRTNRYPNTQCKQRIRILCLMIRIKNIKRTTKISNRKKISFLVKHNPTICNRKQHLCICLFVLFIVEMETIFIQCVNPIFWEF